MLKLLMFDVPVDVTFHMTWHIRFLNNVVSIGVILLNFAFYCNTEMHLESDTTIDYMVFPLVIFAPSVVNAALPILHAVILRYQ